jgi:hypothetical protein
MFETEIANEQKGKQMGTGEIDPSVMLQRWALELLATPEEQRQTILLKMQKDMPITVGLVMKRIQLIQQNIMQAMPQLVEAEQADADREVKREQIVAKKKSQSATKHTAAKRGTP